MAEAEIPNFERVISLTKCGKFVPKREMPRLRPRARSVGRSGDQKGFVRRDHGGRDGWTAAQGAWPIDGFQREKGGRLGRTGGKVKSQGKGEKVALYSAAAICQTPSAEEGLQGDSWIA